MINLSSSLLAVKRAFLLIFVITIFFSCQDQINSETLLQLVREGNIENLTDKEIDKNLINQKDSLGNTALFLAVEANNLTVVDFLLKKGADPNIENKKHQTALQIAKENGFTELLKIIKSHQYKDWKIRENKFSEDALLYAVENDITTIVTDFLNNGTDSNYTFESTGISLLIQAIFSDSNESVKLLLDNHADPNSFFDTRPAITISAMFGQYAITKMLLDAGADPNLPDGPLTTALMLAAEEGHADVVKLLLEYGADEKLRDLNKETALDKAVNNEHLDVVRLF
ncbi:MAG: ankyrin repeat domain-containing protein [Flavobacteriaceae bacterium]|nr:ankyrin repeat domain-containing protein [Flavobacteriaceae bacterium]